MVGGELSGENAPSSWGIPSVSAVGDGFAASFLFFALVPIGDLSGARTGVVSAVVAGTAAENAAGITATALSATGRDTVGVAAVMAAETAAGFAAGIAASVAADAAVDGVLFVAMGLLAAAPWVAAAGLMARVVAGGAARAGWLRRARSDLASLHIRYLSLRLSFGFRRAGFFRFAAAALSAATPADCGAAAAGRLEKRMHSPPLLFSSTSLAQRPAATHSW
ncbi:MAG: hypothetical protein NT160_07135 [Actinobacteria bacterium]|nr:hypothetical protein [Actinomycetota bacterium]